MSGRPNNDKYMQLKRLTFFSDHKVIYKVNGSVKVLLTIK
jgi:hypothetical protein